MGIFFMRLSKYVFILMLLGLMIGCEGSKGDKGDTGSMGEQGTQGDQGNQGDQGDPGDPGEDAEFEVYTGTIPGDGIMGIVSIGSAPLPSNTQVTVLYAFPSVPDIWVELGQPDSAVANPWCGVSYEDAEVGFFNCSTTWLYKIIVMKPALSPKLSAKERFDYFRF